MIKRPEKKKEVEYIEDNMNKDDAYSNGYEMGMADGYNAACDDWIKFLKVNLNALVEIDIDKVEEEMWKVGYDENREGWYLWISVLKTDNPIKLKEGITMNFVWEGKCPKCGSKKIGDYKYYWTCHHCGHTEDIVQKEKK